MTADTFGFFSWWTYPTVDFAERLVMSGSKLVMVFGENAFRYGWINRLPIIDVSQTTSSSLFGMCRGCEPLKTIDEIKIREDGSNSWGSAFASCKALENIKITGVIGNVISFADSPNLTSASVDSIIGALKRLTEGESAKTLTLHATVKANMTDTQKAIIQEKGWSLA